MNLNVAAESAAVCSSRAYLWTVQDIGVTVQKLNMLEFFVGVDFEMSKSRARSSMQPTTVA